MTDAPAPPLLPPLRELAKASALAVAVLLALFGSLVWGGTAAIGGDTRHFFLPWVVAWLRDGAGWLPWTFAGAPLLADPQSTLLYPATWLLKLWGAEGAASGLTVAQMLHFAFSGVGMFALARRFAGFHGSLLALALWLCGAFYTFRIQPGILVFVYTVAWLPWHALATHWLAAGERRRGAGALALTGGMQLLAGMPQMTFVTWFGGGVLLVAWRDFGRADAKPLAADLAAYAGAAAGAVLLAMPHLWAVRGFQALADPRTGGDLWRFITGDSLQLRHVATWFFPELFAPASDLAHWSGLTGFHEVAGYATVAGWVLGLAGLGIALRGGEDLGARRAAGAFIAVAAVGFALAFGSSSPLFRIAFEVLPGFDLFRVPARWALWVGVTLAVGAAMAFDRLAEWDADRNRQLFVTAGAVLLAALACRALLPQLLDSLGFQRKLLEFAPAVREELEEGLLGSARRSVEWTFGLLAGGALLTLLLWRRRSSPGVLLAVLLAFTVVDAKRYWRPYSLDFPTREEEAFVDAPERYFRLSPAAAALDRLYLESPLVERLSALSATGRVLHLDDVQGWQFDQFTPELLYEGPVVSRIESARGYRQLLLSGTVRDLQAAVDGYEPGMRVAPFLRFPGLNRIEPLAAYNVRWVLTYGAGQPMRELEALGLRPVERITAEGLMLLENPSARGWAWIGAGDDWSAEPQPGLGRVRRVDRSAQAEEYQVELSAPGVLHVSTADHPGWKWEALPTGGEALGPRSVGLPAGTHTVRRSFTSDTGGTGVWLLSALGWIGAAVLAGWRPRGLPTKTG
ncbi:MAG: hypothetical protein SF028_04790 [Candidatus Sumerlaeia bacterium]|nr:hypothetical protein [Candidatus Sumerlaeia bacterium]